jgi:hypothetical protein
MSLRIRAKELEIEKVDARQGRLAIVFRQSADLPPRLFTLISKYNREAYLTKDAFIWPFNGDPVMAIEGMLNGIRDCLNEIEASRKLLNL